MSEVFVIRNQLGHYWAKSKAWVSGADPRSVLRVKHQDEGVNTLFELSAKDITLRGEVIAAELGPKGEPVLEVSDIPVPEIVDASPGESPDEAAGDTGGDAPNADSSGAGETNGESPRQSTAGDQAVETVGDAVSNEAISNDAVRKDQ